MSGYPGYLAVWFKDGLYFDSWAQDARVAHLNADPKGGFVIDHREGAGETALSGLHHALCVAGATLGFFERRADDRTELAYALGDACGFEIEALVRAHGARLHWCCGKVFTVVVSDWLDNEK